MADAFAQPFPGEPHTRRADGGQRSDTHQQGEAEDSDERALFHGEALFASVGVVVKTCRRSSAKLESGRGTSPTCDRRSSLTAPYKNCDILVTEAQTTPPPRRAARLSWILPLIAVCLSLVSSQVMNPDGTSTTPARVLGGLGVLLAASGMLLALFAFTGIPNYGPKGVVLPAICGVLLCSVYLGLFMLTMARVRQAAMTAEQNVKAAEE